MSQASEEVRAELDAAASQPFGIARSAAVEALVERADQLGDGALAVQARLHLMTAYSYGGEPLKRFPVFSWLLQRYDEDRELFDSDTEYRLFWMFKWVTVGVVEHPAVPRERILASLEEMAARYQAAGDGPAPVLATRFQVLARMQGHAAAEEVYRDWTASPRTPLSDCLTCEPALRVWHLAGLGRDADALGMAFPVLDHGGCADQPQRMIGHALEPLMRLGMADRAAREHLRGVRLLRERPGSTASWAQHVLLCARTGRLHRGLDLLEHRLHEVDDAPAPEDAMWLAAAGARLLRGLEDAGEADLPVAEYSIGDGGMVEHAAGELRTRLARRALDLADRFDRRNQTTTVGTLVKSWLEAEPLPDLPIDRVLTRPRTPAPERPDPATAWRARPVPGARRGPAASSVRPPAAPGDHTGPIDLRLIGSSTTTLTAALEDADRSGAAVERRAVLERWAALRSSSGAQDPGDERAVAVLEAALALERAEHGLITPDDAREAALRLNESGAAGAALRHALACVRLDQAAGGDPADLLADARALLAEGERVASPGDRACLHLGVTALLRAVAAERRALPATPAQLLGEAAEVAERGLAIVGDVPPTELTPVQRGCLALLLRDRAMGRPHDRLTHLATAHDLLPPGTRARERALVGYALGTELARDGQLGPACEVLAACADDALTAGDEELAVHTQHALGRALADAGDHAGAVQALSRAIELCGPHAGVLLLAELRQALAAALRDSGQLMEAAELADAALDELEDALAGWGIEPAPGDPMLAAQPAAEPGGEPARVAGDLAFTAAQCAQDLDELDLATDMARRAAAWQHGHGRVEAEALMLAAGCTRHPAEAADLYARAAGVYTAAGRWWEAAACRRSRAMSVLDSRGAQEALDVLEQAGAELAAVAPAPAETARLDWEGLALTEQAVRVLAGAGRLEQALERCGGLDRAFRDLGDRASAREVVGLRARVLDELGRTAEVLAALSEAAQEALNDGDGRQAARLGGYLSAFLDDLGREEEAAQVWARFEPR